MSESNTPEWVLLLRSETRRRWIDESLARIRQCVDRLSEEEVWHRFNENTLTVGNILLHLRGNIRQWIICGLGGEADDRQRDQEFVALRSAGKAELFKRLEEIVHQSEKIVSSLSAAEFVRPRVIQGMNETGISAIVHVTEHLSYHTGEMTYITKLLKNVDTKYYDSTKLRARNQSAR